MKTDEGAGGPAAVHHRIVSPSSPSSSPTDCIDAAVRLKRSSDSFVRRHRDVAEQIRPLARLVDTFVVNLFAQGRTVLSRTGRFFPDDDHRHFRLTISGTERLLHTLESRLQSQPDGPTKPLEGGLWAVEVEEKENLIAKLKAHVQAMSSFSLNLLLGTAQDSRQALYSLQSASQSLSSPTDDPALSELERLYDHLLNRAIAHRDNQKRAGETDLLRQQQQRQSQIDAVFAEWTSLLEETELCTDRLSYLPLINNGRAHIAEGKHARRSDGVRRGSIERISSIMASGESPPAGLTAKQFGDRPSSNEHTMDVRRSSSTARDQSTAFHRSYSMATSMSSHPPSIFSAGPSPMETGYSDVTAGTSFDDRRKGSYEGSMLLEASQVSRGALLKFGALEVPLSSFELLNERRGRFVVWNKGAPHQVEQALPSGPAAIPVTRRSDRPSFEVFFSHKNEIRYGTETYHENLRYSFATLEDASAFQSAVRQRHLAHTFDIDTLFTSVSSRSGEPTLQHVKIWRSRNSAASYLCYHSGTNDEAAVHREYPVRWFDRPGAYNKSTAASSVRLNFIKMKRSNSGESRRPSDAISPTSTYLPGFPSRRTSVVSSDVEMEEQASIPSEDISKMSYLDIVFPNGDECDRFLETFTAVHDYVTASELQSTDVSSLPAPPPPSFSKAPVRQTQRATPMGILGLSLTMEQLGLE